MGRDEEATHAALQAHRRELIGPAVSRHRGRIVKTTGDGLLAEFSSVVDAVRCAAEIQRAMLERNAGIEADRQTNLRIGVNVGDVIVDGDDIYGDGVNVAARLEGLAEPGGICLSQTAFDYVRAQLALPFQDLGEHTVKNIEYPVRVFALPAADIANLPAIKEAGPASVADSGHPMALAARHRHSIAVMRFASIGNNPDDVYFADGIVEEVVTALSRFRNLFVVGASTSFLFATGAHSVPEVVSELGVRYVVDGSVRRAGDRVRTTARLIDADTGGQLWADRFDDAVSDVFEVQDRITERIVTVIEPTVLATEIERATRKATENLDAYDLFLRAMSYRGRLTREALIEHHRLLSEAIKLDPTYAPALAYAASCYSINIDQNFDIPWLADRGAGVALADAALSAGPADPVALCRAGHARAALTEDFAGAVGFLDRALDINPNYAEAWIRSSVLRLGLDDLDIALDQSERAIALSPRDRYIYLAFLARATTMLFKGRFQESAEAARRAIGERPQAIWGYHILISALMELGQTTAALSAADAFMRQAPNFKISSWRPRISFWRNNRFDVVEQWLRRAGVPE